MSEALTPLAIRCLGPPSVRVDGHDAPPDVVWRKHLALLVYLALSPDTTRARAHLVGLLWAESPDDKARRSLNEAVRRLRTALGEERLLNRGDGLQLSTAALELDVREFEALCADGQLRALELVRGDFLEGFHVDDAPEFDAWMETERSRLREAARRLVVARAEEQLAVNRYVEARALARRALALDPYSDVALSLAMRSAALEGDPASGVALYHEFAERLERDLGGRPTPQLNALATRIRENKWQRPRGPHPDHEPPLIGLLEEDPALAVAQPRIAAVIETLSAGRTEAGARQFVETVAFGPGMWDQLPQPMRDTFIFNASTWLDEMREPGALAIDLDTLPAYGGPLLMSQGDQSPPFFRAILDRIEESMPRAQRHIFRGAGHVPHLTHPDDYALVVGSFINGVHVL